MKCFGVELVEVIVVFGGKISVLGEVDYFEICVLVLLCFWCELFGFIVEFVFMLKFVLGEFDGECDWIIGWI